MDAPVLIVCATDREKDALGLAPSPALRTLVSGVGAINAALMLGRTLATRKVRGVINLGLAGAFDTGSHPFGSICMVNREIWPEYGLGLEHGVDARALKFPLAEIDGRAIWDHLDLDPDATAKSMSLRFPETWHRADSLTVSTVSATADRAKALQERYSPDLENMEGFALAYGCAMMGVPFLEIRTVSNLVGSRDTTDWNFSAAFAALAECGLALASQLDDTGNDG